MAACMVILMSANQAMAQEDESSSVHITIKEKGKVTTDTTFELKEGQDPEMVEKMVQHMVGEDDCDHKELAWVSVDSDDCWNVTSGDLCINLDSLKEAHGGGNVMVFKDEDGNITVKELGEDEDHELHLEHKGHGDHEIMILESDEGGEKVKIRKMKKGGSHMMIISEDEDMEWTDDDDLEVMVIKKGDKDVKIVKKVKVEIEDESEEGGEKEIEVEVNTQKKTKEKK